MLNINTRTDPPKLRARAHFVHYNEMLVVTFLSIAFNAAIIVSRLSSWIQANTKLNKFETRNHNAEVGRTQCEKIETRRIKCWCSNPEFFGTHALANIHNTIHPLNTSDAGYNHFLKLFAQSLLKDRSSFSISNIVKWQECWYNLSIL